jgi:hypothetical protein
MPQMNASKENARRAMSAVDRIFRLSDGWPPGRHVEDIKLLREFLKAAERKLPAEAAFANATKARKRNAERTANQQEATDEHG